MNSRNYIKDYQKTNYPKIYQATYWGHSMYTGGGEDVFNNRNNFITEFNIKKYKENRPLSTSKLYRYYFGKGIYDHTECYNTHDKNILVFINSPTYPLETCTDINEIEKWNHMQNVGWRRYNCLYQGSTTYIVVINKEEFKQISFKKKKQITFKQKYERYKETNDLLDNINDLKEQIEEFKKTLKELEEEEKAKTKHREDLLKKYNDDIGGFENPNVVC